MKLEDANQWMFHNIIMNRVQYTLNKVNIPEKAGLIAHIQRGSVVLRSPLLNHYLGDYDDEYEAG